MRPRVHHHNRLMTAAALLALALGCGSDDEGGGGGGPDPEPDLTVTDFDVTPASLRYGETVTITTRVHNTGDLDAGNTVIGFRFAAGADGSGEINPRIGYRAVPALAAGESEAAAVSETFTIAGSVTSGTYYLTARADDNSGVVESDENNNLVVTAAAFDLVRAPDLTVTSADQMFAQVAADETITLRADVANIGCDESGPCEVHFYLSTDQTLDVGTDTLLGTQPVALDAGDGKMVTLAANVGSTTGDFYVVVEITVMAGVSEEDDTNNVAVSADPITIIATGTGVADMAVEVDETHATLYMGAYMNLYIYYRSVGSASYVGNVTGHLYLSEDDVLDGGDTMIDSGYMVIGADIPPGGEDDFRFDSVIPALPTAGYLIGSITVTDGNGANDQDTFAVAVVQAPNLVPDGASTTDPLGGIAARFGDTITVTVNFSETAGGDAGPFDISTKAINVAHNGGIIHFDDTSVTGLAASASDSVDLSYTLDEFSLPGSYYVWYDVDCHSDVYETDENDNTTPDRDPTELRVDVLPVNAAPGEHNLVALGAWLDLATTTGGGGETLYQLEAGSEFVAFCRVGSFGDDIAGTVDLTVYAAPSEMMFWETAPIIGTATVDADDLEGETVRVTCTAPANVGAQYFWGVMLDAQDAVSELNELDNRFPSFGYFLPQIEILAGGTGTVDLFTESELDIHPIVSIELDQPYYLSHWFRLAGASADTGPFAVSFYASTDATITTGDTLIGQREYTNAAAGLDVDDDDPASFIEVVVPSSSLSAGEYYIGYIVDSGAAVAEGDENNNASVTADTITVIDTGGAADLAVLLASADDAPTVRCTSGAAATFDSYLCANLGTRPAAAAGVSVYLSSDQTVSTGTDQVVGTTTCPALEAGMFLTVRGAVALDLSGVAAGTYYAYAVIDPAGAIAEMDETNNDSATLTIGGSPIGAFLTVVVDAAGVSAPDLEGEVDVDDSFTDAGLGTEIWLSAGVRNRSLVTGAAGSAATLYLSTDPTASIVAGDEYLFTAGVGRLDAGGGFHISWDGTVPVDPATGTDYYIKILVDSLEEVTEADETNNVTVSDAFQFVP